MVVFKKFGYTFRIRNDDWKQLRERFNPKNAVLVNGEGYEIRRYCPLCSRYLKCKGCTFKKLKADIFPGCMNFFSGLYYDKKFNTNQRSEISWDKKNNKQARRQLYRLQRMMDEIEEQNKRRASNV